METESFFLFRKWVLILSVVSLFSYSQEKVAPGIYWVRFTDKNNTTYSIERPEEFLSARSIIRRQSQSIQTTESDLPVSSFYADSLKKMGCTLKCTSRWLNSVLLSVSDTNILSQIRQLSFVENTPFRMRSKTFLGHEFRDKLFIQRSPQAEYDNTMGEYPATATQISQINLNCLHDQGYKGSGKLIAVLDAGFPRVNTNPAFDSLRFRNGILGTWDFPSGNDQVYDDDTHGAYVLSILAAILPGQYLGSAPEANYLLLRTENNDYEYRVEEIYWVMGAEYADSAGADIISSSLGYDVFNEESQSYSWQDLDGNTGICTVGADMAAARGMLVVNSAGNEGNGSWKYISVPADGDSVLTVGGVNGSGDFVSFSSRGPTADGRIKPDVAAMAGGTSYISLSGSIEQGNGTSFSAPLVSGAAACLWQANSSKASMDVYHAIKQSASQYPYPDTLKGEGIPNFCLASSILTKVDEGPIHDLSLLVYPNPVKDLLHIDVSGISESVVIGIHDVYGRAVWPERKFTPVHPHDPIHIDLSMIGKGLYTIEMQIAGRRLVRKIERTD